MVLILDLLGGSGCITEGVITSESFFKFIFIAKVSYAHIVSGARQRLMQMKKNHL